MSDKLTPDEFYEEYLEADREGNVDRILDLDNKAEAWGEEYERAKRRAEEQRFEEFQEWLNQGGREVTEHERARAKAMYRQKIRSGEVPLRDVLRRLGRTALRLANIYEMAGEHILPLDSVFRKMKDVEIAAESQTDTEYDLTTDGEGG